MKQLFELQTKNFKRYYVLASGYDEAKTKVENRIIKNDTQSILTSDGSLNNRYRHDEIDAIRCLGDSLII